MQGGKKPMSIGGKEGRISYSKKSANEKGEAVWRTKPEEQR